MTSPVITHVHDGPNDDRWRSGALMTFLAETNDSTLQDAGRDHQPVRAAFERTLRIPARRDRLFPTISDYSRLLPDELCTARLPATVEQSVAHAK